jgi:hypothetical protein
LGFGFLVQGSEFRIQDSGFRVEPPPPVFLGAISKFGSRCTLFVAAARRMITCLGFRVQGFSDLGVEFKY